MLIEQIRCPEDLRALPEEKMPELASEIRQFLIEKVNKCGGHLASNLGVVELSIALHRVFDIPNDKLIFDVGHQSYVHKILTGRKDLFDNLRHEDGVSGFTKRSESKYDVFGAGHSSTSISAAIGFAEAAKLKGDKSWSIALIGDGAFTGGLAYEAINNCYKDAKVMIILNDNEMSISENVGMMPKYISKIRTSKKYINFKKEVKGVLPSKSFIYEALGSFKDTLKSIFVKEATFFQNMGLAYYGPVDGNDYERVKFIIETAKKADKNCVIHVTTKKGLGYAPAENDPRHFHAVAPAEAVKSQLPTFSKSFGIALTDFAKEDGKICAVTAAMADGTGLSRFSDVFPERFFDVGIAEGHAVTFCGGLSASGMKPVFAVYSPFLQRAYDNLIHDIASQGLDIILGIDRAGLSPDDGITHHGIYDVGFISQIKGSTILAPISTKSIAPMLSYLCKKSGICAVRYPKGVENTALCEIFYSSEEDYKSIGVKTAFFTDNTKYVFISYGRSADECVKAARKLNSEESGSAAVILLEIVSPDDGISEQVNSLIPRNAKCVFCEEGVKIGGAGMILQAKLAEKYGKIIKVCAIDHIPDRANSVENFYKMCGIDCDSLIRAVKDN